MAFLANKTHALLTRDRLLFYYLSPLPQQLAGPSVCQAFRQLLVRLQARADILCFASELTTGQAATAGTQLKETLLNLLYLLVQNKGPLTTNVGPLDVQCEFVQHLLHLHFSAAHLPTAMSILESVGKWFF